MLLKSACVCEFGIIFKESIENFFILFSSMDLKFQIT